MVIAGHMARLSSTTRQPSGVSPNTLTTLLPDDASAQRGGVRGGGMGGFRGAAMGGGFRGAAIGSGYRGAGMGFRAAPMGGGFRTASIGGFRGVGPGIARVGP